MPKWLSRTLLIILGLVVFAAALFGAFRLGNRVGVHREAIDQAWSLPNQDNRQDGQPLWHSERAPLAPMLRFGGRVGRSPGFPIRGLVFGGLSALVRLGLLVLLIWLVVKFVTRGNQPAPAPVAPPTPASEPVPPPDPGTHDTP